MSIPIGDALAAPDELARVLRGAPVDDALAEDLLRRASAVVRAYCGWHITRQIAREFVVDGTGTRTLLIPTLALAAVTSITEDGQPVDLAEVDWSVGGMLERRNGRRWTRRLSGVRVVADHGLDEPPDDVSAVVLGLAAKAYANPTSQETAAAGVVSDRFGPGHGPVSLTQVERHLLAPWRLR